MEIVIKNEGDHLKIVLEGRLDTTTSPELETILEQEIPKVKNVEIDLMDLQYISSAGLRVMVFGHKKLAAQNGHFTLKNPNEYVRDVFATTGLDSVLDIEG